MIVFVQNFFTHLLEIGLHHQPCCHVLCGPLSNVPVDSSYLVPIFNLNTTNDVKILTIDLPTLDLVYLSIPSNFLVKVFKKETSMEVRLGIIHYFLCHKSNPEILSELISTMVEKSRSRDVVRIMQEFLISGSQATVQKNLMTDALPLLALIPVTTLDECSTTGYKAKVNELDVTMSHEKLWNTSVMLLSPQQRLVPYKCDLWTRLWDLLSKRSDELPRFKPDHVVEKLSVSLACYQPEALSRCSTPMSPSGG